MKIALCLYKYFPYGGLQRDFLRIARECQQRGHEIHVYTSRWQGQQESWLQLHIINTSGWTNHQRNRIFTEQLKLALQQEHYDLVIGFDKMPHLDLYYAADVCYQGRVRAKRGWLYRLLPRYRQMIKLEHSVFARGQQTQIMLISPLQQTEYTRYYQTETERFYLLPPGIAKDRMAPANAADIRMRVRQQLQLTEDQHLLLMVGSGFKTKGLDRSLRALAALPAAQQARTKLFVIGQDDPKTFARLANTLGIADSVHYLGGRPDVPDFLLAADLLLHPSYHENTGTALLEAMVAGLPVLTVAACGYAHYIQNVNAGIVVPAPFVQTEFNTALEKMLSSPDRKLWQQNGLNFAKHADIYSMPQRAADLIEQIGQKRDALS